MTHFQWNLLQRKKKNYVEYVKEQVKIRLSKNRTLFTFTHSVFIFCYVFYSVKEEKNTRLFCSFEINEFEWLLNVEKDLNRFQKILRIQMQIIEWVYNWLPINRQAKLGRNSLVLRITNSSVDRFDWERIWFEFCLEYQVQHWFLVSSPISLI